MTGSKLQQIKGTTCSTCYARKGHYRFANTERAHEERYQKIQDPEWEDAMVAQILLNTDRYFRWFDSGDVQSKEHAQKICNIARRTPGILHWLPSQELSIWRALKDQIPENLIVRVSSIEVGKRRKVTGFLTSMVIKATKKEWPTLENTDVYHCPSSLQGNRCGQCRACWDSSIQTVAYRHH
jgi:hypothetical protein